MGSRPVTSADSVRFGEDFELDLRAYQLRSSGIPVKLKPNQMEILLLLIERRGELVTREQIVERIWGPGVFLDTDNSINAAISRIRQLLRDDAAQPRFVETVTGRGYRFVAAVVEHRLDSAETERAVKASRSGRLIPTADELHAGEGGAKSVLAPGLPKPPQSRRLHYVAISLFLVVAAGLGMLWLRSRPQPAVSNGRVMLAVLPFENLTGDSNQDYFSEGMTEEMITQLGRIDPQRIGVIGRTSVMRYKNDAKALDHIGRELGVQYVLEGSVRRDATKVRITAQLIQVKDQTHLWAQEYDRELTDLLNVQEEIARRISGEIETAFGSDQRIMPAAKATLSQQRYEAYDLYLKGQYFWNKRTAEGFGRAIEYYQAAIVKDANDARAYSGMADCYALMGGYSGYQRPDFAKLARVAATRALELDPELPEAHTAFALVVENYDWDWQAAEKEYRRAIELNPNYATAHHWYSEYLAWHGRFDEALRESEHARQLDPLSLIITTDRASIYYYARQYDRAIEQLRSVQDMDPNFPRGWIASAYAHKGMFTEALRLTERPEVESPWYWAQLASIYGLAGRRTDARNALENLLRLNHRQPVDLRSLITSYIAVGDNEQALALLEKASTEQPNALVALKVEPLYDPLRGDPRFQDLLRRVGLA